MFSKTFVSRAAAALLLGVNVVNAIQLDITSAGMLQTVPGR